MKTNKYLIELSLAFLAYVITLIISLKFLGSGHENQILRTLVSLSPMLPAIAACWVILRQLRRSDELQRIIQLEALAIAFGGTSIITCGYGFLENVDYPHVSMFAVWPIMAGLWVLAQLYATRRYK